MAYELSSLPYSYDALDPVVDAATMRLHHDQHHRAYVEALNRLIADQPQLENKTIEDLLRSLDEVPEAIRADVRNQGGGHANHQLFWKIIAPPNPDGGRPQGELAEQIDRDFGSFDVMKRAFEAAGSRHFGSGWVFLVVEPRSHRLEILTLPNQDSVLTIGKPALLANDLWEHAWYLRHQNRKQDYLKAWWGVVNWAYIGERLRGIREGRKQL